MRHIIRILPLAALGLLQTVCSRPGATTPEPSALATPVNATTQQPAQAQTIEEDTFYTGLEPYGDWVELPDYGWSFSPTVDADWRPYTRGQWENTDDGWYWDSDEDFGWATYHYGRWADDRQYGWVWVPGDEWAPAWVSWRQGNGYTGWAPLPPQATWRENVGLQMGSLDLDAYIGAQDYNFVDDRYLVDRGVYQRVHPSTLNIDILSRTTNVTRYESANNRVYNRGVAVGDVARAIGRDVALRRTVNADRRGKGGGAPTGDLSVFRPKVTISPGKRPSRGHSLIKGDPPPPALIERGQRRHGASQVEVSAREAAKQGPRAPKANPGRPSSQAPHGDQASRPPVDRPSQDRAAQERRDHQGRQRSQADAAAREKKPGKPPGQAAKPPKGDKEDKKDKGGAKEKGNGKGPKPKAKPHG